MSSFTEASAFRPIWEGEHKGKWLVVESFDWFLSSDLSGPFIRVEAGFIFDGATVPRPFTLIFPKVHPAYMQAAALHDWLLTNERSDFSRKEIDLIFKEALEVLNNPEWRVWTMFNGVKAFGLIYERGQYFRSFDM